MASVNRVIIIGNLAYDAWGWLDQPLGQRIKLLRGETSRHFYLTPVYA